MSEALENTVTVIESRQWLEAENVALRHQLIVLRRKVQGRVRLTNNDRWLFIELYRWFPSILQVLTIIRPETLVRWHRAGFRCLSFPTIISGRIGGAVQPGSEWRQWRQIVGLLDARAHLSIMPSACALDYNTPHKRKEFAAGAFR